MDRREAIQELAQLAWVQGNANRDKAIEAIDLAIEALEKLQLSEETSTNGSYIRDGRLMNDLVYRGEAEVDKSTTSKTETVDTDIISRAEVLGYINRVKNSGLGKNKSLEYIDKYVKCMNPAKEIDADLISRQAAIEALEHINIPTQAQREYAIEIFDNIPPVTPTERTGEWYGTGDGYADGELVYDIWECSECGYVIEEDDTDLLPKYCQECGAKMKGGTEND